MCPLGRANRGETGRTGKVLGEAEVKDGEWLRIINAQLRYYLHLPNPDMLSDREWAEYYQELVWIRKKESKGN